MSNNSGNEITIIPAENGWIVYAGSRVRREDMREAHVAENMGSLLSVIEKLAEAPEKEPQA